MPKPIDNDDPEAIPSADTVLLDQAMVLCRQVYENPNDELLIERMGQWQQQSTKHLSSLRQAQQYWQSSAKITPQFDQQGLFNRFSLALQIKMESVWDAVSQAPERWRAWLVIGAPALVTCLLVAIVLLNAPAFNAPKPAIQLSAAINTTYQTQWQQQRGVKLADGSTVQLNWDTKIRVTMNAQQRNVELLSGEAQFAVATDKSRPFIVESQGISATAVGTEFVVRHGNNNQVTITVSEGIVEVASPAAEAVLLTINQKISSSTTRMGRITAVDASTAAAWQQGMLVFHQRPLLDVLEELNRYTGFNIEAGLIFDTDRRVTGTYFTDRAGDALTLIALAFNLELDRQSGDSVVINSTRLKRPD